MKLLHLKRGFYEARLTAYEAKPFQASFTIFAKQKWWAFRVLLTVIFYAQKIRNLHFLSSKISNSAHPVPKIQCLLNGKKWQSLAEYGNKWQWFFCIFPMWFSFPENNRFLAKIITIVTIFYHFITKTAFQFSNNFFTILPYYHFVKLYFRNSWCSESSLMIVLRKRLI